MTPQERKEYYRKWSAANRDKVKAVQAALRVRRRSAFKDKLALAMQQVLSTERNVTRSLEEA